MRIGAGEFAGGIHEGLVQRHHSMRIGSHDEGKWGVYSRGVQIERWGRGSYGDIRK
jgi:hypothetical protein